MTHYPAGKLPRSQSINVDHIPIEKKGVAAPSSSWAIVERQLGRVPGNKTPVAENRTR